MTRAPNGPLARFNLAALLALLVALPATPGAARVLVNPGTARHISAIPWIATGPETSGLQFGVSLAVGNFNGDAYEDLAIGVPGFDVSINDDILNKVGAVKILYGGHDGLSPYQSTLLLERVSPAPQQHSGFGLALVAGDFDQDGYDELAVGAPSYTYDNPFTADAGAVLVFPGGASGLQQNAIRWTQGTFVPGDRGAYEDFGSALASGDFNHDGFADLAIGTPSDQINGKKQGSVNVIYGSSAGLSIFDAELWHQDLAGIEGVGEDGDGFGASLAAGDLNHDNHDDLAIGMPGEDVGTANSAGAVNLLYGTAGGLAIQAGAATSAQLWQDLLAAGDAESSEQFDQFGSALHIFQSPIVATSYLAIGSPGEDSHYGLVQSLFTSAGGPVIANIAEFRRATPGLLGESFASGYLAEVNGIPGNELVVGAPAHGMVFGPAPGSVWIGASPIGSPVGGEPSAFGLASQSDMHFGGAVAVGDFNGRGSDEVAIGSPWWDACNAEPLPPVCVDSGMITIVDDTLFANGFE